MQKHTQLFRHDPENKVYGDCHRTAIACLLDMKPEQVPHFLEENPSNSNEGADAWLKSQGWSLVVLLYQENLETVLETQNTYNPDQYYMLSGISPRGTDHVVIGCGGKIVWDPHPDGGGLVAPCKGSVYWVEFLVPLSQTRKGKIHE